MKTSFIVCLLLLSTSIHAESGKEGGGGNALPTKKVSVAVIQNAVYESPLFVRAWINGIETKFEGRLWLYKQKTNLPKGAAKIAKLNNSTALDELIINFRSDSPCSNDAKDHDGSAGSYGEKEICISGFSLSKKLNNTDYKIQTEALIVHELAHLMGANEEEATALQNRYFTDMQYVSKELVETQIDDTTDGLMGTSSLLKAFSAYLSKPEDLCIKIYEARSALGSAASSPNTASIEVITADRRNILESLQVQVGQVWQQLVCGQQQNTFKWLESYHKGFANKERVSVPEWLINRGATNVNSDVAGYVMLKHRKSVAELAEDFEQVAESLKELSWHIFANATKKWKIEIVE